MFRVLLNIINVALGNGKSQVEVAAHSLRPICFLLCSWRVAVFSQSGSGLYLPRVRDFLITHNDAAQSVGLLWTSNQSVAETST